MEKQEAQLSQRDSATLRVIEYFAKSLKIIRNDTVEYGVETITVSRTISEIFSVKKPG